MVKNTEKFFDKAQQYIQGLLVTRKWNIEQIFDTFQVLYLLNIDGIIKVRRMVLSTQTDKNGEVLKGKEFSDGTIEKCYTNLNPVLYYYRELKNSYIHKNFKN